MSSVSFVNQRTSFILSSRCPTSHFNKFTNFIPIPRRCVIANRNSPGLMHATYKKTCSCHQSRYPRSLHQEKTDTYLQREWLIIEGNTLVGVLQLHDVNRKFCLNSQRGFRFRCGSPRAEGQQSRLSVSL